MLDDDRRGAELVRELISYLIMAVVSEAERRLADARPQSVDEVRRRCQALIAFPPDAAEAEALIKAFLKQRMYRHPRVMRVMDEAETIVRDLFARYSDDPAALPAEWLPEDGENRETRGRKGARIGNFIAGMTDRYAIAEHSGFLTRPRNCVRRRVIRPTHKSQAS